MASNLFISNLFTDPTFFFRIVVILIVSVCLHELGHGFAAISQGDNTPIETGHMTANPIVHMGWPSLIMLFLAGIVWGQMPVNPSRFRTPKWGDIWVSAAGPLVNLGLALTSVMILHLFANFSAISPEFFYLAAQINFVLCIFNLLPIPPLDGFHICSEFFPSLRPLRDSAFGLFGFMILFYTGAFGALYSIANLAIKALVPHYFQ
jgi:Zn-dependent protease